MRELRKVEKAVKEYKKLLLENPEEAKQHKKVYIDDLEILMEFIVVCIEDMAKTFQIWCDTSVSVFEAPTSNIFLKLKRTIDMKIVNYYLNKLSYNLSKAGILQRELEEIQKRFMQYQYFS